MDFLDALKLFGPFFPLSLDMQYKIPAEQVLCITMTDVDGEEEEEDEPCDVVIEGLVGPRQVNVEWRFMTKKPMPASLVVTCNSTEEIENACK